MIDSLEIRWFKHVRSNNYDSLCPFEITSTEVYDWYASSSSDCGIKFRQSNLEIKTKLADFGPTDFLGTHGTVELWRKQKTPLPALYFPEEKDLLASGWLQIRKIRRTLIFSTDGGIAEPSIEWPQNGGQFEWTIIEVNDQRWLSIAFESFGNRQMLFKSLQLLSHHILPFLPPECDLCLSNSFSYPAWLNSEINVEYSTANFLKQ